MKNLQNKKLLYIAAVVVIIAISFGGYAFFFKDDSRPTPMPEGVNLNPPTQAEKEETDRHKEELSNLEEKDEQSTGAKEVKPMITSWGQDDGVFELAARIPGIFEDGGRCTLTLDQRGKTATGTSIGAKNVSDVSCGFIQIPLSKLSPGIWSATVKYQSSAAQGISESMEVTVR